MEQNQMNIFQRMSAVTNEISRVAKNLRVGEGRNEYPAVGDADVLAAVRPAEQKYGVYSHPSSREIVQDYIMTRERETSKGIVKFESQFIRVKTIYKFVNIDNPEEYVEITSYGDGVDTQDKAPGKAMTYSDKYALMKAYKIMTGDDPDQKASPDPKKADNDKWAFKATPTQYPGSAYSGNETERLRNMILQSCDRAKLEAACARKYGKPFDALDKSELREVHEMMEAKKEANTK